MIITIDQITPEMEAQFRESKKILEMLEILDSSPARIRNNVAMQITHPPDCGCKHDWKKYVGLTEVYEYCTKCPETRKLDEQ